MRRLPNPPEVFEGREEERRWVASRLEANPITIVWGAPGLGKTGLALRVAADASFGRAAYATALDTPDPATFLPELCRRMAPPGSEADARSLVHANEMDLRLHALDLAERSRAVWIMDDLHALPAPFVERLFLTLSRYAEASRWLFLTRARPTHDELADKTLRLDPLPDDAVRRVVRRCSSSLRDAEIDRLALASHGSPHRARHLALTEGRPASRSVLADLSDPGRRAVNALRLLSTAAALPDDLTRELDGRGLVRLEGSGVRLDDRLRPLIDAEPIDRAAARRDALALLASDEAPSARFETLRLLIEDGDERAALGELTAHRASLFATGYAYGIFDLLQDRGAPRLGADASGGAAFRPHLFACAFWTTSGAPLAWALRQDPPEDPKDRLAFCELLTCGGAIDRALAEARALVEHGSEAARVDAAIVLGDQLRTASRPHEALRVLRGVRPTNDRQRIDRDVRLVNALAIAGDVTESRALLRSLPEDLARLDPHDRRRLQVPVAGALLAAGRFRDLEQLIGDRDPPSDARGSELFAALALSLERGRLDQAARLIDRVRPYLDESVSLRFMSGLATVRLRLVRGPLAGLDAFAKARSLDLQLLRYPELAVWARCARASVDLLSHPPAHLEDLPAGLDLPEGTTRAVWDAWRAIVHARVDRPATAPSPAGLPMDAQILAWRAAAEVALQQGELASADDAITHGLDLARSNGLALEEVGLVALLLDLRLVQAQDAAGGFALAQVAAQTLASLAAHLGSARLAEEAELGAWLATSPRDAQGLLDLASRATSPIVIRRAGALLGQTPILDALDVRVLRCATTPEADAGDALLLDLAERALRLPSGRIVDLAAADLHVRLLEVLARGHGRATKEALVREAWAQPKYHPLRDDKRLHVAIYRLRKLLGDDAGKPALLHRDEDGYRLGVPIRLGRLRM